MNQYDVYNVYKAIQLVEKTPISSSVSGCRWFRFREPAIASELPFLGINIFSGFTLINCCKTFLVRMYVSSECQFPEPSIASYALLSGISLS